MKAMLSDSEYRLNDEMEEDLKEAFLNNKEGEETEGEKE